MELSTAGTERVDVDQCRAACAALTQLGQIENYAWRTVSRARATIERAADKLADHAFARACESSFVSMFNGEGNIWTDLRRVEATIVARCDDCQRAMDLPQRLRDEVAGLRQLYPVVLDQADAIRELLESEPGDSALRDIATQVRAGLPTYPPAGLSPWEDMNDVTSRVSKALSVVSDCRAGLLVVLDHLKSVERTRPEAVELAERVERLINDPDVPAGLQAAAKPHLAAVLGYVRDGASANLRANVRELTALLGEPAAEGDSEEAAE
jgi:hypothetical protein